MATVLAKRGAVIVEKPIKRYSPRKSEKESFKLRVANIMRDQGASEEFIMKELTDNAIEEAILNHFTAESLAWVLLQ